MGTQQEKPATELDTELEVNTSEVPEQTINEDHLLDLDEPLAEALTAELSADADNTLTASEMSPEAVAELIQKLAQSEQNAQENWDKMVRIQAEMENQKRRIQKDLENAHKFALERFAKELLNVIDSLELGIQASVGNSPDIVKLREGSELTLKQFEATLAKFNIVAVAALGQPFNPDHHQAISIQPSAEVAPNTVLNVFQKGYLLNDRLLRPAMVVVSKAVDLPPENTPKIDEQA